MAAIALAAIGCVNGTAQAQSNVAVYGILNLSVDSQSTSINGAATRVAKLSSNSSLLGLRGTEDLGGGLAAIFKIEGKIGADTGTGGVNNRDTFVGIRGNFGTVKLGYMDPPIDDIKSIFGSAPTGITSILNTSALWTNGASDYLASSPKVNNGFISMNETLPNSLRYELPRSGNIGGSFQYSHPKTNEDPGSPHNIGAQLSYSDNQTRAAFAIYRDVGVRGAGLNDQSAVLTAGTRFGKFYVAAAYTRQDSDWNGGKIRRNFWGASTTYTSGQNRVYAFYSKVGNGSLSNPTLGNTGAQMAEISYNYDLSKRTTLYAGYVKIFNEANATYQLSTNRLPGGDAGASPSGFILGIKHNF